MLNALIIVPEGLDITDATWQAQNAEVAWELSEVLNVYTPDKSPGTQYDSPTKLVHAIVKKSSDNPLALLESLLINYGLHDEGWLIIGLQNFDADIPAVYDVGDPEADPPIPPSLVTPAKPMVYKNVDTVKLFPYLQDRHTYDENGNITGTLTKELNWMHQYQGMEPWE